eukprot:TRINITY_DN11982_c0_g1_i2.p1 TRINITY_DN11982_c0_g1~~TRINITY_DN11982_c0_g1_i2.p1  ORF type:complete len:672 (-),score=126.48 TRINITY_DN11982_c0_g1_i2:126-2141(-)
MVVRDVVWIDTEFACREACKRLAASPPTAVDVEGTDIGFHNGGLCLLQAASRTGPVYLFDLQTMGTAAMEAGLGRILQDDNLLKLTFDPRMDAEALLNGYGVSLAGVFDLQVLFCWASNKSFERLPGMSKVISGVTSLSDGDRDRLAALKERGRAYFVPELGGSEAAWETRPLPDVLKEYAASDVDVLFDIYDEWRETVDEVLVSAISAKRLKRCVAQAGVIKDARRDFPVPAELRTLYVGGLRADVKWDDLLVELSKFGQVRKLRCESDSRFAFVEYEEENHAKNALSKYSVRRSGGAFTKLSWPDRVSSYVFDYLGLNEEVRRPSLSAPAVNAAAAAKLGALGIPPPPPRGLRVDGSDASVVTDTTRFPSGDAEGVDGYHSEHGWSRDMQSSRRSDDLVAATAAIHKLCNIKPASAKDANSNLSDEIWSQQTWCGSSWGNHHWRDEDSQRALDNVHNWHPQVMSSTFDENDWKDDDGGTESLLEACTAHLNRTVVDDEYAIPQESSFTDRGSEADNSSSASDCSFDQSAPHRDESEDDPCNDDVTVEDAEIIRNRLERIAWTNHEDSDRWPSLLYGIFIALGRKQLEQMFGHLILSLRLDLNLTPLKLAQFAHGLDKATAADLQRAAAESFTSRPVKILKVLRFLRSFPTEVRRPLSAIILQMINQDRT